MLKHRVGRSAKQLEKLLVGLLDLVDPPSEFEQQNKERCEGIFKLDLKT